MTIHFHNPNYVLQCLPLPFTQGVLAPKFPISIGTQTQGQYKCQKVQKLLKNHVQVSNFATMLLNLRKPKKYTKILGKRYFLKKNAI